MDRYSEISKKVEDLQLWYIASPYRDIDEKVEEQRAHDISAITACMINGNPNVVPISPIAYTHVLQEDYGAHPKVGWYAFDLKILEKCDRLVVVMLDGWETSVGVNIEIAHALKSDIPIDYVKVHESDNSISIDLSGAGQRKKLIQSASQRIINAARYAEGFKDVENS